MKGLPVSIPVTGEALYLLKYGLAGRNSFCMKEWIHGQNRLQLMFYVLCAMSDQS